MMTPLLVSGWESSTPHKEHLGGESARLFQGTSEASDPAHKSRCAAEPCYVGPIHLSRRQDWRDTERASREETMTTTLTFDDADDQAWYNGGYFYAARNYTETGSISP